MNQFKSTDLLAVLVALIELQIFAVEAKRVWPINAARKYLGVHANTHKGVCYNIYETPSRLVECVSSEWILERIMLDAPSNTSGSLAYPVNPPTSHVGVQRCDMFATSDAFAMWGDHPYADNRRQLISEMIDQLRVELNGRGYKL